MSSIYFPLRSNAASLLSGAPIHSVMRRIKLAALLHDKVLIEDGTWSGQAGPRGCVTMWGPVDGSRAVKWQTPRERGDAVGKEFVVAIGAMPPLTVSGFI